MNINRSELLVHHLELRGIGEIMANLNLDRMESTKTTRRLSVIGWVSIMPYK